MSTQKKLKIKILDQEYPIVSENEERALQVSEFVDSLMREFRAEYGDQNPLNIAILTLLNITNDYFADRDLASDSMKEALERIRKLNILLEDFLK